MRTHAAEIAEKLQGAHERRTGKRREDTRMIIDENTNPELRVIRELGEQFTAMRTRIAELENGEPQASAVTAERVVELERQVRGYDEDRRTERDRADRLGAQLAEVTADRDRARALNLEKIQEVGTVKGELDAALMRVAELERANEDLSDRNAALELQRDEAERSNSRVIDELEQLRDLLATAYVAREVPWTDVATGMMTIARDGTPWMVKNWTMSDSTVVLVNGTTAFEKVPADGETVRVLVPYVTDEQAQGLVASELGGTEVGS